ncbi:pathogenesis-related protein PRMS [Selaginella moellendorffii]|nr:pathogenesis-related protein PRMS [Selaginella moellendorffii]|eukprot:XP_002968963.2 pathogenesis-related protein PRMS [Selaginella moellendorffii]
MNSLIGLLLLSILAMADVIHSSSFSSLSSSFLDPQNAARARVGVAPLVWDDRLAAFALAWANSRRIFGACSLQHSRGPYGENIFWGSGGAGRSWNPSDAVESWMSERRWYDYGTNSCLGGRGACGHYTQVVSRFSRRVGCARVQCGRGDVFMACDYFPPGNNGQRPF